MVFKDLSPAGEPLKRKDYKHVNWNLFQHYLVQVDWETIFSFQILTLYGLVIQKQ